MAGCLFDARKRWQIKALRIFRKKSSRIVKKGVDIFAIIGYYKRVAAVIA